jgi:hypothetical protein
MTKQNINHWLKHTNYLEGFYSQLISNPIYGCATDWTADYRDVAKRLHYLRLLNLLIQPSPWPKVVE